MWLTALLLACANSGLDRSDLSAGTGDTGAVASGDCPWVGEWRLVTISCQAFPVDEWADDYGSAELDISDAEGGGCEVEAKIRGTDCAQTEDWHLSTPVGSEVAIDMKGVSDCAPADCVFPGDAVCAVGSAVRNIPDGYIADLDGDLQAEGLLQDTVPTCTLEVVTVWTRN